MLRLVPKNVRTIRLWALYNPKLRLIVEQKRFKYELRTPSKNSGLVVLELKGFYVNGSSPP
jgi:hypothetical protein